MRHFFSSFSTKSSTYFHLRQRWLLHHTIFIRCSWQRIKYFTKCWCTENALNHFFSLFFCVYSKLKKKTQSKTFTSICLHKFYWVKPNIPFMIIAVHAIVFLSLFCCFLVDVKELKVSGRYDRKFCHFSCIFFSLLYTSFLVNGNDMMVM